MVKQIKYAKNVPEEIQELMGFEPYYYIGGYYSTNWRQPYVRSQPKLETSVLYTEIITSTELEDLKATIDSILLLPNYLSGDVYYYDDAVTIEYYLEKAPTQKELKEFDYKLALWAKENTKYCELKDLIQKLEQKERNASKAFILQQELAQLKKLKENLSLEKVESDIAKLEAKIKKLS